MRQPNTVLSGTVPGAFVKLEGHTLPFGATVETWLEHVTPQTSLSGDDADASPSCDAILLQELHEGGALDTVWLTYTVSAPQGVLVEMACAGFRVYLAKWQEAFPVPEPGVLEAVNWSRPTRKVVESAVRTLDEYGRILEPVWNNLGAEEAACAAPPFTNRRAVVSTSLGHLARTLAGTRWDTQRPLLRHVLELMWDLAATLFRDREKAHALARGLHGLWVDVFKAVVPVVKPPDASIESLVYEGVRHLKERGIEVDPRTVGEIVKFLQREGEVSYWQALRELLVSQGLPESVTGEESGGGEEGGE